MTVVLPYIAVAAHYFAGEMEFGVISQTATSFRMLQSGLGILVNQSTKLSKLGASTRRVDELKQMMENCENYHGVQDHASVQGQDDQLRKTNQMIGMITTTYIDQTGESPDNKSPGVLNIHWLTVFTPSRSSMLIQELNLCLERRESLLIVGPSGVGKTSLLRAMAGLWRSGLGSITRPPDSKCRFLPQKPYLPLGGTLREQLLYPGFTLRRGEEEAKAPGDEELAAAMDKCALEKLQARLRPAGGFDAQAERWESILSLGEQQRLAFARLAIHAKVDLALLDEATSALDEASEAICYKMLADTVETYVSVGHRPSLIRYHSRVLSIETSSDPAIASRIARFSAAEYQTRLKV
ncbi:unnamed protein product [Polarella glacialis]|uniref:ABC transporter domain-containing protein n=1 Tax=Polarella glacialis TaxID=89957 RepID=A0A813JPB0_POLGL|nr:unnamed protein product [Polarella glacialis]